MKFNAADLKRAREVHANLSRAISNLERVADVQSCRQMIALRRKLGKALKRLEGVA